jgi:anti-anti-sigma factor
MDIEVDKLADNVSCIRLLGRMDSASVDGAETRFSAAVVAPGHNAVVDLSGVSFLASMGIRLFITSARALSAKGARMVLYGPNDMVRNVLEHVALDQIIPIVGSQEQAVAKLAS